MSIPAPYESELLKAAEELLRAVSVEWRYPPWVVEAMERLRAEIEKKRGGSSQLTEDASVG